MSDLNLGRALRDAQLDLFERKATEFLSHCRALAVEVCKKQGSVCINDIRSHVQLPAHMHPSVLGSVFKSKKFRVVGFTEAKHKQAHARIIRVYELVKGV